MCGREGEEALRMCESSVDGMYPLLNVVIHCISSVQLG